MQIVAKLPTMKVREIMQLWKNAVTILSDEKRVSMHANARAVISAIGNEWNRRRRTPIDPDEFFRWPTTEVGRSSGNITTDGWLVEGVLQFMGYKVGKTEGLPTRLRQRILNEIFTGVIPPVFPHRYLDEWGDPGSAHRLRKLAETLAALTRNAKRRRDSIMATAIEHWEQDLEFLYYEFYVEKFQFAWPTTELG